MMRLPVRLHWGLPLMAAGVALTAGCSGVQTEYNYPDRKPGQQNDPAGSTKKSEGLFGPDGFSLFGKSSTPDDTGGSAGLGVNTYLWRASLDSVSFMPLSSAD